MNDEPPLELLDRAYAALSAEFAARRPEDHTFTWYDPDQTVGFWIRDMAQETVIHRVDAELAAGRPIAAIPGDPRGRRHRRAARRLYAVRHRPFARQIRQPARVRRRPYCRRCDAAWIVAGAPRGRELAGGRAGNGQSGRYGAGPGPGRAALAMEPKQRKGDNHRRSRHDHTASQGRCCRAGPSLGELTPRS